MIIYKPEPYKKPPHYYVPSYVYTTSAPPMHTQSARQNPAKAQPTEKKAEGFAKPLSKQPSMMASTAQWLQQNQLQTLTRSRNIEPILLVGDKSEIADPLIKLLGKALSAHFKYPREEGMWGIKGRVIVEMTLHPDGRFTDVNIVESSNNHNLDMAALYAVNSAPLVIGASKYISAPKHFVVGFGFYLQ